VAAPRCRNCGGTEWTTTGATADDLGRCVACREFPTLGFQVVQFIAAKCVVPDREQIGQPFIPIGEQARFALHHYRVSPTAVYDEQKGRWVGVFHHYRGSQLTRPQKWGKGPWAGALVCAEADGPVVFDGWDAKGQPVGRPWPTPLIQITALSADQAGNVWDALLPMIQLADLDADIPDTGETRINLPRGGKIVPVTSSAKSRLGQRTTFVVQDQTESWYASNGGRDLADNQRRNLGGTGGRWLSTPNAWDPTEESVAQYTAEEEVKVGGVYLDDVEPSKGLTIDNKEERKRALRQVYGDAWWVDLDRIDGEIRALLPRDPAQAERWYLNRKEAKSARAFNGVKWDENFKPGYMPEPGALIVIGVDGARFVDALAIVATEVVTGFQWPLAIVERPENAGDDYEHPIEKDGEVDGVMVDAFELYDVWRVYIDPGSATGNIEPLVELWEGRWGTNRVIRWLMSRPRQVCIAVRNYSDAIATGKVPHDGDETLTRHIKNTVKKPEKIHDESDPTRKLHSITKDKPGSPNKIDGAAAGLLSWRARGDAIAADATTRPSDAVEQQSLRPDSGTPVVRRGDLVLQGDQYIDRDPGDRGNIKRGR